MYWIDAAPLREVAGRNHQGETVRWDELFADMEAQLAQAEQRSVELEAAETARAELSRLTLAERLSAHRNRMVSR